MGGEVLKRIIDYAFPTLNYHKVIGEVNVTNTRSLGMCKKLGFIKEGHQKDMEYINREWTDINSRIFLRISKFSCYNHGIKIYYHH